MSESILQAPGEDAEIKLRRSLLVESFYFSNGNMNRTLFK